MFRRNKYRHRVLHAMPLAALCLLTLAACSDDDGPSALDNSWKTPIELSVGIVGDGSDATRSAGAPARTTRAVVTTDSPYGQSATAFSEATSLYMVMKCDKETATISTKYARTIGTVAAGQLPVSFADGYKRYYEDACPAPSHDAKVSIYAACVPGKSNAITIGTSNVYSASSWTKDAPATTVTWPLGRTNDDKKEIHQNGDDGFIDSQDLCFSNNIGNLDASDNRIAYNSTTKKFTTDKTTAGNDPERGGKMIFYHALTKVTFKLIKGDGFTADDVFAFTNDDGIDENLELVGFNTAGTFNLTTGEFSSVTTENIEEMAITIDNRTGAERGRYGIKTGELYAYVLDALMLPGSDLTSTATNEINFHIDYNTYHVRKCDLAAALDGKTLTNGDDALYTDGTAKRMRPGVHYIFTLTVNKKDVSSITAAIAPWEEVEANNVPTNTKITIDLLDNGNHLNGSPAPFDLYRLVHVHTDIDHDRADYTWMNAVGAPGESDYADAGNKAILTGSGPAYVADGWYWTNNKTFYHFRTVSPTTETVYKDNDGDYILLKRGTAPGTYTDVCWGAPFTNIVVTGNERKWLKYSETTGFDKKTWAEGANEATDDPIYSQIYKAIGPTEGTIHMEMFHMMSNVSIILQTTSSASGDHVELNEAKMTLTNIYPEGIVRMGNGKVEPSGTAATVESTELTLSYNNVDDKSSMLNFGFVPQDLDGVVLTITTADNNQYEVMMKDLTATLSNISQNLLANPYTEVPSAGSGIYKIHRWYPNYKYTYTFTLKKKGVADITATINEWETVTAENDNVQIK